MIAFGKNAGQSPCSVAASTPGPCRWDVACRAILRRLLPVKRVAVGSLRRRGSGFEIWKRRSGTRSRPGLETTSATPHGIGDDLVVRRAAYHELERLEEPETFLNAQFQAKVLGPVGAYDGRYVALLTEIWRPRKRVAAAARSLDQPALLRLPPSMEVLVIITTFRSCGRAQYRAPNARGQGPPCGRFRLQP